MFLRNHNASKLCKEARLHCVCRLLVVSAELGKPQGLQGSEKRGASQGPKADLALYFLAILHPLSS